MCSEAYCCTHLLHILVEGHVRELDGPRRRARDVAALDVAVPRSGLLGLVDADVHRDRHVHLPLREHPERGLDRLHGIALLQHGGHRVVVEQAWPWYGRERSARGLFDADAAVPS